MKEGINILKISDNDAKVLRENNYGWAVIGGAGTYHRKQVIEDRFVLKFLKDYHDSIRIKTVTK